MTREEVLTFLAYDRWANRRLLESARQLSGAAFSKNLGASFGSIRGTLVHLLWGESGWLCFWRDAHFIPEFDEADFPHVDSLEERWQALERERLAFAEKLTDEKLVGIRGVDDYEYTLGELMQQTFNHSTYHRGQVALLLRQLG